MSVTDKIVGYENNNEIDNKKQNKNIPQQNKQSSLKQRRSSSLLHNNSIQSTQSTATASSTSSSSFLMGKNCTAVGGAPLHLPPTQHKLMNSKRKYVNKYSSMAGGHHTHARLSASSHLNDHNNFLHLNSLWSIWYGVLLTLFQGYLAVHGAYRFLGCSLIPWKIEPVAELNLQIVLSGVVFILLPLFFTSAVFKVGNLANDGIKLATGTKIPRQCSITPADGLEEEAGGGTLRALWTHGGPTAAFVHIVIAMCLLLPRLLLEARIIENGLLSKENIWQTELDFIAVNRRNFVVLSVVPAPYQNITSFEGTTSDEDYFNDTMYTAINNNLLETNTNLNPEQKPKQTDNGNVAGKTRFFEVPDLINRVGDEYNDFNEQRGISGLDGGIKPVDENGDDVKIDDGKVESKNNVELTGRANVVQSLDNSTTISLVTLITVATPSPILTSSVSAKNYDKSWDKLSTIGKHNSLDSVPQNTTTSTTSTSSSTSSSTSTTASTITTTTATSLPTTRITEIPFTTGESATTTSGSISKITLTSTVQPSNPTVSVTSTIFPTPSTIQTTGTYPTQHNHHHHHQHHNQQRHQHQQHEHHHQHGNKSGSRKHIYRQHHQHRQRGQNTRRHHGTTTMTTLTSGINLNRFDEHDEASVIKSKSYSFAEETTNDLGRARAYFPKSTSAISPMTTRDSNIHIVKPEILPPEIIPSTPLTSNSKIIEIKTKLSKKVKRMADDSELQVEIEPEYLIGDPPGVGGFDTSGNTYPNGNESKENSQNNSIDYVMTTSSSSENYDEVELRSRLSSTNASPASANVPPQSIARLDGFAGMLQIFFGIEKPIDVNIFSQPPSAEFVNFLFALLVWCVRYPAVFWTTTKPFATIFSIQMIAACLDIMFGYIGIANLYKFQVYSEAMPIQNPGLILNGIVTLSLYLLSTVLVLTSSMIMYLYGHGRLAAKMRDRSLITIKASETWIYFAHCASFCFILALAVVKAPLLNDLTAIYKSNLHCPTFLSALISVVYLLLWVVIWLVLTAKRRWTFKLPPVGNFGITKATTQPLLLAANCGSLPCVGGNVHTSYEKGVIVGNASTKGMDYGVGVKNCGQNKADIGTNVPNGADDDIYWPKLPPNSPKMKVTFNEVASTCDDDVLLIDDGQQNRQQRQQPQRMLNDDKKRNSPRGAQVCFTGTPGEIDDGEYATLRAATAATIVGIGININTSGGNCPTPHGDNDATIPTGGNLNIVGSVRILHYNENDELPPPPPPQMLPMTQNNPTSNSNEQNNNNDRNGMMGSSRTTAITEIIGDYANCGIVFDDNISEEGKLLECVRDDSITYASTRELDPPRPPVQTPTLDTHNNNNNNNSNSNNNHSSASISISRGRAPQAIPENMQLSSSPEHLVSPLAPVTVTVHTNEAHIHSSSTPRVLRRADSGVPNEVLTPRSETTSTTESTTSPPERAPSESSSGVHSGEERDVEVVIRPRVGHKPPQLAKLPQPAIEEEPYGRCTNMRMSSFISDPTSSRITGVMNAPNSSATLPLTRTAPEQKFDYSHCSTMPLPAGSHSQLGGSYSCSSAHSMMQQSQNLSTFKSMYANSSVAMAGANATAQQQQQLQQQQQSLHTTLPNGVRYSNPQHILRRLPHVSKTAESPYGHLGLGAGHHTFSKLVHDPVQSIGNCIAGTAIPEDRDSANYSMNSDYDTNLYATANHLR